MGQREVLSLLRSHWECGDCDWRSAKVLWKEINMNGMIFCRASVKHSLIRLSADGRIDVRRVDGWCLYYRYHARFRCPGFLRR